MNTQFNKGQQMHNVYLTTIFLSENLEIYLHIKLSENVEIPMEHLV